MANYLTQQINRFLAPDWSVLDLCCGNGLVSDGFTCRSITGVDIYRPYLDQYLARVNNASVLERNLATIMRNSVDIAPQSYDVVICADGVEHLEPEPSTELISWMESIARHRVVIFTPLNVNNPGGIVLNTPHNAWGIEGGNNWQEHRCGYAPDFFISRGYQAYSLHTHLNSYDGTPYTEMLYVKSSPIVAEARHGGSRPLCAFGSDAPAGVGP